MRVLLINPNRYRCPPVLPLGLEYLLSSLRAHGHDAKVLDLCFIDPLERALSEVEGALVDRYDLVGVSIRNVDTVLFQNNEFFLPDIRRIVQLVEGRGLQVVLGGSGFSIAPDSVLRYMGASYGIVGPGESAILQLLEDLGKGSADYRMLDGWRMGFDRELSHSRGGDLDYPRYLAEGALVGFETQKGCLHRCSYCVEAGTTYRAKDPQEVVREIVLLARQGHDRFHLCDAEFNLDLCHCKSFLRALIGEGLDITWTLYMVPSNYDEELFSLLRDSHADLVTLSVCSDARERARAGYTMDDVADIIDLCKRYGIKLAVDLLCGFPSETIESVGAAIDFFKEHRPSSVGVNFHFRLYENTLLKEELVNVDDLARCISFSPESVEEVPQDLFPYLAPSFYVGVTMEEVLSMIDGDPLFRIEGLERTVNYQRV
jgi:radical SAM superfamily enzyme YgiQ (UPF0313 family)